ncbi:MAG TPA: phage baseplate assembly protein V [Acetobacteraceae bacterium]|nr:phage baseplate assembly protein V [Acetobacteraceae bacterium]
MNDAMLQDLLAHVRQRFYGKYRGVVVDTDASTMRIKASVPAVLPNQTTGWCLPCVPYAGPQVGFVMLPEVGTGVWIEFEGGDVSFPIWTGCYWNAGDIPGAAAVGVNSIITQAGTLSLDNNAGSVKLQDSGGDGLSIASSSATLKAGSGTIDVGSGVSINSGALEVN